MRRVGYVSGLACIGHPAESRDATDDTGWYVHPDATIEAYATVDSGTVQMTRVDADAWIFKHAHVGHDAHVMEGAEVSTGAVIGGHAIIGPHAKIGINATILPWRVIGRRARKHLLDERRAPHVAHQLRFRIGRCRRGLDEHDDFVDVR